MELKVETTGNYILVGDWEVVKSYKTFKDAKWDLDFFHLMYRDVRIYKLVVKDDKLVNVE